MSRPELFPFDPEDWDDQATEVFEGTPDESFRPLISAFRLAVELSSWTSASLGQADFAEPVHPGDPFVQSRELANAFADLLDYEWSALVDSVAVSVSGLVPVLKPRDIQDGLELRSGSVPSISSQVARVHPQNAPPERVLLWES